jgi:hypothetical protein
MGARVFDPYNIVLLRAIFPLECLVLVHSGDLAIVHRIPNLLRLKRDLRVSFVSYDNVNEALNHKFTALFPRSGLVVMDTGTLVHCNPGEYYNIYSCCHLSVFFVCLLLSNLLSFIAVYFKAFGD